MPDDDYLGSFEQLVLLAIVRLGDNAYGMTVRREIDGRTGRSVSLGAIYATLDRLEAKGYVTSRQGDSGAARSGRAKRFFRVESSGRAALRRSLAVIEAMSKGLHGLHRSIGGAT